MAVKGVDLSVHNGKVDFAALKRAGVQFAILRAGYGGDYPGQQDSKFEEYIRRCEAAGLPWGAYHYSYARDRAGALAEAKHFLRLLKGRKPAYGAWFDMEDDTTLGGDLAGAAEVFCGEMEKAGLYAGVYSNYNWFTHYLTAPVFDKFDRWVAQYNPTCDLKKPYGIWQFTDGWVVGGKEFDCDWAYKDYLALTAGSKGENSVSNASRVLQTQPNRVTNPFGNGHSGVDLGWQDTQTDGILAHSPGKVVFCQTGYGNNKGSTGNASYGNCVKIAHPNGWYTLYAHLSEVCVAYGQQVQAGQRIGKMGNSGNSYGSHLHFEVRNKNDVCVDPAPYLAADLPGLKTNITINKEDEPMTAAEKATMEKLIKRVDDLEAKQKVYKTLADVPDYWRDDIRELMDKKILRGSGQDELGLTHSEAKAAVIVKRAFEQLAEVAAEPAAE